MTLLRAGPSDGDLTAEARFCRLSPRVISAPRPLATYVPVVISGGLAFTAGHGPLGNDGLPVWTGALGESIDRQDARDAARLATQNLLTSLRQAIGSLDRVEQVCKLTGYVLSAAGGDGVGAVVDGASELIFEVFGDAIGGHSRADVSVSGCVMGLSVTVDGIFAVKERDYQQ